jgi:hypothetical protein
MGAEFTRHNRLMRNLAMVFFSLFLLCGVAFGQESKKPEAPKPPAKEEAAPKADAKPAPPPVISIEKSSKPDPCVIRPVMSDKELRECGAQLPGK